MQKGIIGEIYNIGSDHSNEYSVMEVAIKLIKLIKQTDEYNNYIEFIEDRPFNDKRYFISNDKLTLLGWEQTINFDDGLKLIILDLKIK
jgi:dTDP-glucose 4,6-dehydratase/UDP-glucose 4,6-dehydratase